MQYQYKTKYLRISARKIRPITSFFKNQEVDQTLEMLILRPEKAATLILGTLKSAIASAKDKGAIGNDLKIKSIIVDEGPVLKRRLIKPRGRADLIKKRMSHLTIVLKDKRKKKNKRVKVDQKVKI